MNNSFRFYTMANDSRAKQFERFIKFFNSTYSAANLRVIPFDDDNEDIIALSREYSNITIVEPNQLIDRIARSIFSKDEYRPRIPAWRYLRKLNAFIDHEERFIFHDLNYIPLLDIREHIDEKKIGKAPFIYFLTSAVPGRCIKHDGAASFLDLLSPGTSVGYNAGTIFSQGGAVNFKIARKLASRKLRDIIGPAPEQGFLSIYMSLFGLTHGQLSSIVPNVWFRSFPDQQDIVKGSGNFLQATIADSTYILAGIKQSGHELKPLPEQVKLLGY